jgi:hypothetical protein
METDSPWQWLTVTQTKLLEFGMSNGNPPSDLLKFCTTEVNLRCLKLANLHILKSNIVMCEDVTVTYSEV